MVTAIIQARMGSTRFPGKVLKMVRGRPLLSYQLERIRKSSMVEQVVVATTVSPQDEEIEKFCKEEKLNYIRGSQEDVLARFYQAAKEFKAKIIVRLTADCPLIDPGLIDEAVDFYKNNTDLYDYAANTVPPPSTFPDGMDVEVFSFSVLERAFLEARLPSEREHVTFYLWKTGKFRTYQIKRSPDYSQYRFTVDYPQDFEVVSEILEQLYPKNNFFTMEDAVGFVNARRHLLEKQKGIERNSGWEKSLEKDREFNQ